MLYEAAIADPRSQAKRGSRSWGLKLMKRVGFKRAAVAVARKLSVIMHAMGRDGATFDPTIMAA